MQKISPVEIERLEEIKFFLLIENLILAHGKSMLSIEIIENIAQTYGCDITVIKKISRNLMTFRTSPYRPSKVELACILGKAGYPIRQIRELTRIHPSTYYKYVEDYKKAGEYEFQTRMTQEERNEIKKFLSGIEALSHIFSAIIRR